MPFNPAIAAGLAGSDTGAAWSNGNGTVSFVSPAGTVQTGRLPDLGGDTVVGIGTGGGTVGIGTDGGRVLSWKPGNKISVIGRMPGAVISVAAYGDHILAIDDFGAATLFTPEGQFAVSGKAAPFGVAMSSEYAVWPEVKGRLEAGVIRGGTSDFPETDLYLLSLSTGNIYDLIPEQGQQGFPALSGRRLAWQDAAFGGDDILTVELPAGL